LDVSLPSHFGDEPAAGFQSFRNRADNGDGVKHPMESGVGEDRVEFIVKSDRGSVLEDEAEVGEVLACLAKHAGRGVEANDLSTAFRDLISKLAGAAP
jgi:hypothetical protein